MEAQSNRIYHPWHVWEDYPAGFYDKPTGAAKVGMIEKVVELFCKAGLTRHFMNCVVTDWPYSAEHNLTNASMNRIAYLGQGACCIYAGIPSSVTMEAWSQVPEPLQRQADAIAEEILTKWLNERSNA